MALTTSKLKVQSGGMTDYVLLYDSLEDVYGHGLKVVVGGKTLYACYTNDLTNANMSKLRFSSGGSTYGVAKMAAKGLTVLTDAKYTMRDIYPDTYQTMTYVPDNFDASQLTTMENMFAGCAALKEIPKINTSKITSFHGCFSGCTSLPAIFPWVIDLAGVPPVEYSNYLSGVFDSNSPVKHISVRNTASDSTILARLMGDSNMTVHIVDGDIPFATTTIVMTDENHTMSKIYPDTYTTMTEIPDILDTSQLTNAFNMFMGCAALKKIPAMDLSKVTNVNNMFDGCSSLTEIPALNTTSATSMSKLLNDCTALTRIAGLDTSSATDISFIFEGCSSLTEIPALDTSNAKYVNGMFHGCAALTTIPVLDMSKVTDAGGMFYGCTALKSIPFTLNLDAYAALTSRAVKSICANSGLTKITIKVNDSMDKSTITGATFGKADMSVSIEGYITDNTDWASVVATAKSTGVITIPDGAPRIPAETFKSLGITITNIVIPDSVTEIGDKAFYDNDWSCGTVNLNRVKTIGTFAFGNPWTTNRTTPCIETLQMDNVATISSYALYEQRIHYVLIGSAIQIIASDAFSGLVRRYKTQTNLSDAYQADVRIDRITDGVTGAKWGARNSRVTWTGTT